MIRVPDLHVTSAREAYQLRENYRVQLLWQGSASIDQTVIGNIRRGVPAVARAMFSDEDMARGSPPHYEIEFLIPQDSRLITDPTASPSPPRAVSGGRDIGASAASGASARSSSLPLSRARRPASTTTGNPRSSSIGAISLHQQNLGPPTVTRSRRTSPSNSASTAQLRGRPVSNLCGTVKAADPKLREVTAQAIRR